MSEPTLPKGACAVADEKTVGFGWGVFGPEVVPLNDLRPHSIGDGCWCDPFYDGDILVHNSMDGREAYERGRKLS